MRHFLRCIATKPQDYKICNHCGFLNWYENEECWNCSTTHELKPKFSKSVKEIKKWTKDEIDYILEDYEVEV